ncbi:Uncharacterized protein FWK35_00030804, partial [Aphis craccivora]
MTFQAFPYKNTNIGSPHRASMCLSFNYSNCLTGNKSKNAIQIHSERSEECIDFTMIITSRNNAPISNYEGGFRCKSEYPWCIIQ